MKALKGNKEYIIDEKQKKAYLEAGFDIKDDDGKVIAYGRGKTVPYADHAALKAENEALKAENEALKARNAELEALLGAKDEGATESKTEPEKNTGKK